MSFFRMGMALVLIGFASVALAQERNVALLASACAVCHGTNGYSQGGTPKLAGLDEMYFEKQMLQFRNGERESTVMAQHASGYTEEEIRLLAHYFAQQ